MWLLTEERQGQGFATEAARVRRYTAETLGWQRIVSCIEAENTASVRVALRLGAIREYQRVTPPLDGRRFDVYAHWMDRT